MPSKDTQLILDKLNEFNGLKEEVTSLRQDLNTLYTTVTSLDRQVARIDQRLANVADELVGIRQQTSIIPDIIDAFGNFSSDIDDHEIRIRRLEHA